MGVFFGRWTLSEQTAFQHGLAMYGTNWRAIARLIPTRTLVQIRTHAQKYFMRHGIPSISELMPLEAVIAADLGEGAVVQSHGSDDADSGSEGFDKFAGRGEKRRQIAQQLKAQLALIAAGGWEDAPTGGSGVAKESSSSSGGGSSAGGKRKAAKRSGGPVKGSMLALARPPAAAFDDLEPPRAEASPGRRWGMGVSVYPGPGLPADVADTESAAAEALRLLGEAAAAAEAEGSAGAAMSDDEEGHAEALAAAQYLGGPVPAVPLFQVAPAGVPAATAGRPAGWRPLEGEAGPASAAPPAASPASFRVVARAAATLRHVALEPLHPIDNLGLLLAPAAVVAAPRQGQAPAAADPAAGGAPSHAIVVDGFVPIATASRTLQRPVSVHMPTSMLGYELPPGVPEPPSFPTACPAPTGEAAAALAAAGVGKPTLREAPVSVPFPVSAATVVPGAAEESDLVRIGDVVLGVSGVCVVGMSVAQVQRTIAAARAVTPGGIVVLHLADVTVEAGLVEEAALQMANAAAALLGSRDAVEDVQDAVLDMHSHPDLLLPHLPLSWALETPRVQGEVTATSGNPSVAPLGGVPFHELQGASLQPARLGLGVHTVPAPPQELVELLSRPGGFPVGVSAEEARLLADAAANGERTLTQVTAHVKRNRAQAAGVAGGVSSSARAPPTGPVAGMAPGASMTPLGSAGVVVAPAEAAPAAAAASGHGAAAASGAAGVAAHAYSAAMAAPSEAGSSSGGGYSAAAAEAPPAAAEGAASTGGGLKLKLRVGAGPGGEAAAAGSSAMES